MTDPRLVVWGWAALEADFLRFYRLDLNAAAFDNRMTWRRFLVLVRGLGEDSAWQRFLADKDSRRFASYIPPTPPMAASSP